LDRVLFYTSGIYIEDDRCYYEVDAIVFDREKTLAGEILSEDFRDTYSAF